MTAEFEAYLKSGIPLSPWVVGPVAAILWLAILLPLKKWLLGTARKYLEGRTSWIWADSLIEAMSPSLTVAVLAGGLALLDRILPLSARTDHAFDIILAALLVTALIIFVDRLCRRLLTHLAQRSAVLEGALGLLHGGVRGIIIGIGVLVFLDSIGISITPIAASLGIGSLAVALALQDTLANLFAGVYMIAEKPIAAGHFIKLEGGEQGYVTKVGWRSTHIRMLTDSVVVVPNAKLAGSVITNFSLPQNEIAVSIDVGVHYDSDLERVENVTLEVAREIVTQVNGALSHFEPRLRYHTFSDSSINFTLWLGAENYMASLVVKHEFVKRLHARYRREDIVLPYPTRTVEIPASTVSNLAQIINERRQNNTQSVESGDAEENSLSRQPR
jgi:small-conductance mechanosensitive channel